MRSTTFIHGKRGIDWFQPSITRLNIGLMKKKNGMRARHEKQQQRIDIGDSSSSPSAVLPRPSYLRSDIK